jgi:hypothetical protein
MGAWGYNHFENDTAYDFMSDVEESGDPKEVIRETLEAAASSEYLDSDGGCCVIVSATYLDSQMNGTRFTTPESEEQLPVDTFAQRNPGVNLRDLKEIAAAALSRVMGVDSELKDLWEEADEYDEWKSEVSSLLNRITAQ